MESARLAVSSDLDSILYLADAVSTELQPHRGGEVFLLREGLAGSTPEPIRAALADDTTIVVVGQFDEVTFGYGIATLEPHGEQFLGRLQAFAVQADARGVGVGEAMMNLLQQGLRDRGCFAVDSQALPGDRHTKNFFESFGLKARLLTVNKLL